MVGGEVINIIPINNVILYPCSMFFSCKVKKLDYPFFVHQVDFYPAPTLYQ